jgi:hypothetical protein
MFTIAVNSADVRSVEIGSMSVQVNFATTVKDCEIGDRNFHCTEAEKSLRSRVAFQMLQIPENLNRATACLFKTITSGSRHSVHFCVDNEAMADCLKDPAFINSGLGHPLQLHIQGLLAFNLINQSQAIQARDYLISTLPK